MHGFPAKLSTGRPATGTLLLALCLAVPALGRAQETADTGEASAPASMDDVGSIDAIIAALYDVISGPAGEARDWDRFRSLYVPGARLIPTGVNPSGQGAHQIWTIDEYVTRAGPVLEERGFFEIEAARVTEEFGNLAHAFSTYESRNNETDEDPFQRGINSIQLFNDGNRWWIVTILWDSERPDNQIPERYQGG